MAADLEGRAGILERSMRAAIEEAEASLREGNHGFGAVILRDGEVLAAAHDTDETDGDPTAHAELKAIRHAAAALGKDLSSCTLVSTHEPCPMCSGAIVWSGISRLVYGYGIADATAQGRDRISLACQEVFDRAHHDIEVSAGMLKAQCAVLYDRDVRRELRRLRGSSDERLREYDEECAARRAEWYQRQGRLIAAQTSDPLERAYRVLLARLGVQEEDAPISHRGPRRIVFQSANPCPTLEACRILHLDTRAVCRLYNEGATDSLVRLVDPRLRFRRNDAGLRPHAASCEEMIEYAEPRDPEG